MKPAIPAGMDYVLEALRLQRDLYLRRGDVVHFVLDAKYEWLLSGGFLDPVFSVDYRWSAQTIPEVTNPGQNYPLSPGVIPPTILWLVSSQSLSHSPTTKAIRDNGAAWVISNPDITPDWLPLLAPAQVRVCDNRAKRLLEVIGESDGPVEVYLESEAGTNLRLQLPRRSWVPETGIRNRSMTCGVFGELTNIPFRASGTLVLEPGDFVTNPINSISERMVLTFDGSRTAVDHDFGSLTAKIEEMIGDGEHGYDLAELSLGLSDALPPLVYRSVVAEKLAGGCHIALGTPVVSAINPNSPEHGKFPYPLWRAKSHVDFILFKLTCRINNRLILINGKRLYR